MRPLDYLPLDGRTGKVIVAVDSDSGGTEKAAVGTRVSGRTRAFLKVQDGCDHSCAYCAVTLVRGESRSVPFGEIRQALDRVLAAGFQEVVLTGVDVTAWGKDLEGEHRDFTALVELAASSGLPRVRISSVEPWEITRERIEKLAAIPSGAPIFTFPCKVATKSY